MTDEKYIAIKIKELRKNAGLDVDTVGAGVGRSGKTVSAWETGRNVPSAEMLITICRFFGVSIDYFYPPDVVDSSEEQRIELSNDELELISLYREMGVSDKAVLLETARRFAAFTGVEQRGGTESVGIVVS